jgi:ribosomal protein S12 methylthiotransferase
MTGFPGETDEHFSELLTFVEEEHFDRLGVFRYSAESGTSAEKLDAEAVDPELADERRSRLLAAQQSISRAANEALVGQTLRVLIDVKEGRRLYTARTTADAPEIDNAVHVSGLKKQPEGHFADVVIEGASDYDLEATAAP